MGTADAVKAARQAFEDFAGHVLMLYGDTPLLRAETLDKPCAPSSTTAPISWSSASRPTNPTGYGRLLLDDRGRLDRHPRGEGRERRRSAR